MNHPEPRPGQEHAGASQPERRAKKVSRLASPPGAAVGAKPRRFIPPTARQLAAFLLIPAVAITVAASLLVPWMLETKRRLQNAYWETQLVFAMVALGMAAAGLPSLSLRMLCARPAVAVGSWLVVLAGYAAVFSYIVQSHFAWPGRLVIAAAASGLAWITGLGLTGDLHRFRMRV